MSDDERRKLVSTEQSLGMPAEPKMPSAIAGLETFSLADPREEEGEEQDASDVDQETPDADSFFNLPDDQPEED